MQHFAKILSMLLLISMALTGCGSSGNGTIPGDPLASATPAGTALTASGTVLSYNLSLTLPATVGANADVLARATLLDSTGKPLANQRINFEKIDATAPVTIPTAPPITASNGEAINILKAGAPATTTDVIIKASASINGQYVSSIGIFRILLSTGNIVNFLTTKTITDPDGNLNTLSYTIHKVDPLLSPTFGFVQLVPFEVLDLNGIPRPRAVVSLSIYSVLGSGCSAFIDNPELPAVKTVTTDDNGKGIFNAIVTIPTPPIGAVSSCSVIYKATTDNLISPTNPKIFSYGGFIATLNNLPQ